MKHQAERLDQRRYAAAALRPDNAVSKINTDYETGLCAAMASSIIHINF